MRIDVQLDRVVLAKAQLGQRGGQRLTVAPDARAERLEVKGQAQVIGRVPAHPTPDPLHHPPRVARKAVEHQRDPLRGRHIARRDRAKDRAPVHQLRLAYPRIGRQIPRKDLIEKQPRRALEIARHRARPSLNRRRQVVNVTGEPPRPADKRGRVVHVHRSPGQQIMPPVKRDGNDRGQSRLVRHGHFDPQRMFGRDRGQVGGSGGHRGDNRRTGPRARCLACPHRTEELGRGRVIQSRWQPQGTAVDAAGRLHQIAQEERRLPARRFLDGPAALLLDGDAHKVGGQGSVHRRRDDRDLQLRRRPRRGRVVQFHSQVAHAAATHRIEQFTGRQGVVGAHAALRVAFLQLGQLQHIERHRRAGGDHLEDFHRPVGLRPAQRGGQCVDDRVPLRLHFLIDRVPRIDAGDAKVGVQVEQRQIDRLVRAVVDGQLNLLPRGDGCAVSLVVQRRCAATGLPGAVGPVIDHRLQFDPTLQPAYGRGIVQPLHVAIDRHVFQRGRGPHRAVARRRRLLRPQQMPGAVRHHIPALVHGHDKLGGVLTVALTVHCDEQRRQLRRRPRGEGLPQHRVVAPHGIGSLAPTQRQHLDPCARGRIKKAVQFGPGMVDGDLLHHRNRHRLARHVVALPIDAQPRARRQPHRRAAVDLDVLLRLHGHHQQIGRDGLPHAAKER